MTQRKQPWLSSELCVPPLLRLRLRYAQDERERIIRTSFPQKAQRYYFYPTVLFASLMLCGCTPAWQHLVNKPEPERVDPAAVVFGTLAHEQQAASAWQRLHANEADSTARLELGKLLLLEGNADEAIAVLQPGLAQNPHEVQFYLTLARAMQQGSKKDLPRAIELLETATHLAPARGEIYVQLGHTYAEAGKDSDAIAAYQQALTVTREPAVQLSAHVGLIAAYRKVNDQEQANWHLQAAHLIYPAIDGVFIQATIAQQGPAPVYEGNPGCNPASDHECLEARIRRARAKIEQLARPTRNGGE
ncbi:MAG: tetratricopeptide repeat protein [Candidatus Binatia bacterium]